MRSTDVLLLDQKVILKVQLIRILISRHPRLGYFIERHNYYQITNAYDQLIKIVILYRSNYESMVVYNPIFFFLI